jgi:exodeoxyribonuclease V alpha subunit
VSGSSSAGHWQTDPRHGAQLRPEQATVKPPADGEDMVRYLGSSLIQIGPVLAQRIVAAFGSDTLAVLDSEPERVRQVAGVGQQRAPWIVESWRTHQALRGVSSFLSEHGLDTRFAPRLLGTYEDQARTILRGNPYRLVGEVPGLGFRAPDRLGRGLGVRLSAPPRLQAAIHAALLRAAEQGHTRQQAEQLLAAGCGLTEQGSEVLEPALRQLEEAGVIGTTQRRAAEPDAGELFSAPAQVVARQVTGRLGVYEPVASPASEAFPAPSGLGFGLAGLVTAKEQLSRRLRRLVSRRSAVSPVRLDAWLAAEPSAAHLSLEQPAAVRTAALSSCFVLTGGPGTGKTTRFKVLVKAFEACGRSVVRGLLPAQGARRGGGSARVDPRLLPRVRTDDHLDCAIVARSSPCTPAVDRGGASWITSPCKRRTLTDISVPLVVEPQAEPGLDQDAGAHQGDRIDRGDGEHVRQQVARQHGPSLWGRPGPAPASTGTPSRTRNTRSAPAHGRMTPAIEPTAGSVV